MGQIVKRKKKGRPPKADLPRRPSGGGNTGGAAEPERRRSNRRRNVRYSNFIDYDDYLDEFEEEFEEIEEEEDERRKEKKLKLLLKLHSQHHSKQSRVNKSARGNHARSNGTAPVGAANANANADAEASSSSSSSSSEDEDESERKPLKKRRISGGGGGGGGGGGRADSEAEDESENDRGNNNNNNDDEDDGDEDDDDNDREERGGRKADAKRQDAVPGTPTDHPNGLPLPDKKTLELILDKLQKKDTYGVYAEPVDLEELPDYLEVIDHPMDFATVRKKLGSGSYATLEQFESDVFLICSNAMQYNAPETIYHKQARAIQELAKRKFEKLRLAFERSEKDLKSEQKEIKSEQKPKPNFLPKKQMKKPVSRTLQEPIGSDFSSGATLAMAGDVQNSCVATQPAGPERPSNTDGPVEGNSSLVENSLEKAEELSSGKGILSKLGRKTSVFDENRRATYNSSNQPVVGSESIFMTFESEIKHLVPVGLHAEYSYARSLARFAATLGPVAWKAASQRIEQALPPGCKFGRGWVGEYEPLPTPVLMLETRTQKEPILLPNLHSSVNAPKGDVMSRTTTPAKEPPSRTPAQTKEHPTRTPVPAREHMVRTPVPVKEPSVGGNTSEGKPSVFRPISGPMLEGKPSLFSPAGQKPSTSIFTNNQKQHLPPRNFAETQNKASKQVELNLPPSSYQHDADIVAEKQLSNSSGRVAPKPREVSRGTGVVQPIPSKPLDNNVGGSGGLPNGRVSSNSLNSRMVNSSSDSIPNHMSRPGTYFIPGQDQGLTDPVEAMRISAEKAQKKQRNSNQSAAEASPVKSSIPSARNDPGNAAVAAARAWMSIGAGGFRPPTENSTPGKSQTSAESAYNSIRQFHSQMPHAQSQFSFPPGVQFQSEKTNFPFQAFMRPPIHAGNEGQFQNRPMIFPQLVATDLARFQMQSPWRGVSPNSQPKQKQETLPPDLNIGFQSPESPVKQSSGVIVDSQQPDLALQL